MSKVCFSLSFCRQCTGNLRVSITSSQAPDSDLPELEPISTEPSSIQHEYLPFEVDDYPLDDAVELSDSQLRDPTSDDYNPTLTDAADAVAAAYSPAFLEADMDSGLHEQVLHDHEHACQYPGHDCRRVRTAHRRPSGHERMAPTEVLARAALVELEETLKPHRVSGRGYKESKLDDWTWERLDEVRVFLNHYTAEGSPVRGRWTEAAKLTVQGRFGGKLGRYHRDLLCARARAYIRDRTNVPYNPFGKWNTSRIDALDGLREEIESYLESVGRYVHAVHLYEFMNRSDVQQRYSMDGGISLATAKRWMSDDLDFRWSPTGYRGMYEDGHERPDVVAYRNKFVHYFFENIEPYMRVYDNSGNEVPRDFTCLLPICSWLYDQSTFYGYDRHKGMWVRKNALMDHALHPKGNGPSLMVANFVSADYGWLQSPDGSEKAREFFRAGESREGYFNNDHVLAHAHRGIDILKRHYPNDRHVLFFDNATTHRKRADDALSARHMPKYPSPNFFVNKIIRDPISNERIGTTKARMSNGFLPDGRVQELYYADNHPEYPGFFKGMAQLLKERGYLHADEKRAQCPRFECDPSVADCCCRRILYNQPDFSAVKSLLEEQCEARGVPVFFIPKFHPELTFIEQCWGAAKRKFRSKPLASKESDLVNFVTEALDSVDLLQMRRYGFFVCTSCISMY